MHICAIKSVHMPRTPQQKDPILLSKISRLYYEDECSEAEIAERLHISRSKVSRLLKEARRVGIVKIHIVPPPGSYPWLEAELEKRYGLKEAVVVTSGDDDRFDTMHNLGAAAARHLQESLQSGETIGVSWGRTLHAMVAAIQPQRTRDTRVIQIIGGLGQPTAEVHATELCRRMANALTSDLVLLPVPGIMESRQAKEAVLTDSNIQKVLALFRQIDVAYVGIGAPGQDSVMLTDSTIMRHKDLDEMIRLGAVGDIAVRFFNRSGEPIQSELDERVIGIRLEELKQIERRVGVSGGLKKVDTVRAALLAGYVNILITDQRLAEALLNAPDPDRETGDSNTTL
jgi:DNA-binding transcriptional regulator LsrR (DeoR family)